MLVLVTATCVLALYTAILGMRCEKRLTRRGVTQETRRFITSYKSFKQTAKVLLVLFTFQIVDRVVRIISFWFPLSTAVTLFQLLNFIGLVIECWTYGLGHATVRAHIRRYLCRRRVSSPAELPPIQRLAELSPIQQTAELPPIQRLADRVVSDPAAGRAASDPAASRVASDSTASRATFESTSRRAAYDPTAGRAAYDPTASRVASDPAV